MIRMEAKNSIYLFILILFASCGGKTFDSTEEYMKYINDEENGFSQVKEINGVKVKLTFKPTDFMVLQELSNSSNQTVSKESLKNKYDKNLYFVLSYSRDNKELLSTISTSREEYNSIQDALTFGMTRKVSLVNQDRDTIQMIDYNFARTYGMSRSTNLLFIFKRDEILKKSKELIFNVQDIGLAIGDIKFKYSAEIVKEN